MSGISYQQYWSVRMADSVMKCYSKYMDKWCYELGLMLKAIEQVWKKTNDYKYYQYIKENIDKFVNEEGKIDTYWMEEFNIDQVNSGKILFTLFNETGDERYKNAACLIREQLRRHPRTTEGGFWHKRIYPHQMWLDGIYMGAPFYTQFAKEFNEPDAFEDIAKQVIVMANHARDPKTGLLYHAWDESKGMKWSDNQNGCSAHFWGRAIGWYVMAIVDILDHFPENHKDREKLIEIFQDVIIAVAAVQDKETRVWYQVLDLGFREGNYLEASASCMFVYAIAKGIRKGYLNTEYIEVAKKGYEGIVKQFIEVDEQGLVHLAGICSVAGLGGNPYRDGSFEYYISEPVHMDDYKGVGPFILASIEMESMNSTV